MQIAKPTFTHRHTPAKTNLTLPLTIKFGLKSAIALGPMRVDIGQQHAAGNRF